MADGGSLKEVVRSLARAISKDRISLIAAGCTYYLLLALFPALAAFVSLYGFIASPETVVDHIAFLGDVLPESALDIIEDQLDLLASASAGSLSLALIVGLAVGVWSANNGIKMLFQAMNVAYHADEQRSFIKLNVVTLGFTLGGLLLAIALIASIGVAPLVLNLIGLGAWAEALIAWARWPLLLLLVLAGFALLYRYGPSRPLPRWRAVVPGSLFAAAGWVIASVLFSWYLANFANYSATYGALGAVIGALTWLWLSMFILIIGAELNAILDQRRAEALPETETVGESGERVAAIEVKQPTMEAGRKGPDRSIAEVVGFLTGTNLRRTISTLRRRFFRRSGRREAEPD